jgi:hypothetical protein
LLQIVVVSSSFLFYFYSPIVDNDTNVLGQFNIDSLNFVNVSESNIAVFQSPLNNTEESMEPSLSRALSLSLSNNSSIAVTGSRGICSVYDGKRKLVMYDMEGTDEMQ